MESNILKLGSHDSMSYLPPKNWLLYPFRLIARCQSVSIEEQYKIGCRMFDIRVKFDKSGHPYFCHGSMRFKGDVYSVLNYLNTLNDDIYVRLLSEYRKPTDRQKKSFLIFCEYIEQKYNNLKFFCGRSKGDWKQLYKFQHDDIDIDQPVSSMTWLVLDDWFPWGYAHFMNQKNFDSRNRDKWILMDFVNNLKIHNI